MLNDCERRYIELSELHRHREFHDRQKEIVQAIFVDRYRRIFVECGRNFGKTFLASYLLWRFAKCFPGSENYYFAPLTKQAKEVIWVPHRIQNFGPKNWLLHGSRGTNNSELRLRFKNGSFIKIDGADNIDSYRGVKLKNEGLVVYDEFKDFKAGFYHAMDPNLLNCTLVILGSPATEFNHFDTIADEFKANPRKYYINAPSWSNLRFAGTEKQTIQYLKDKRAELYRNGQEIEWQREWAAKRVKGSERHIFPMSFTFETTPHCEILEAIRKDRKKLKWYCIADPGTTTCFGVLYIAYNSYTKHIHVLDSIYETDQHETSVQKIGPQIIAKCKEYEYADWTLRRDEAAAWFEVEMLSVNKEYYFPGVDKRITSKKDGISIIKDILFHRKITISDRAEKLLWELQNAKAKENGDAIKENDHLIDALRYFIYDSGYSLNEEEYKKQLGKRRLEDEFTPEGVDSMYMSDKYE